MRILFLLTLLISISANAQDKAFVIYNIKGKKVSYKKMIKTLSKKEVVLFGEYHNNPISHWLELEVTKSLHKTNKLVLGAEMIETDNQVYLDQYLQEKISFADFDSLSRLWKNYPTDYAPLIDFAKDNKLQFVASNVPRRYARMVNHYGVESLDTLPAVDKSWMAPLPYPFDIELPTYQKILKMMGEHGSHNLVKAQAIKDATMAHSILKYRQSGATFLHYNGAFHSDYYEGIGWYLKTYEPTVTIGTISTVSQADITQLLDEHKGKADFIICVDEDMTTTY